MMTILLTDSRGSWIGLKKLPLSIIVETMVTPIALPSGENNRDVLNKAVTGAGARWLGRSFEDDTRFCRCVGLELMCA